MTWGDRGIPKTWRNMNGYGVNTFSFINSEKERAQFRDELIDLVKLKVLTKKEKVNYDEINGKIISLSDLQYKNEKYFYPKE